MKITHPYIARGKAKRELDELKGLVRDFLKATEHVPFRAIDCDQETVYALWDKLTRAVGEKNERV